MRNAHIDTSLLDRAICFAVSAHRNTERRGKGYPYIVHPLEVVSIVATMTSDQELLAAAALHDTVEDTDISIEDIRKEFGHRIADLVEVETDSFIDGVADEDSWHERKRGAIERIAASSRDAQMVALGDKLSNARIIYRDYIEMGDEVWNLFHVKDKASHKWHYEGLAAALEPLSDTFAYKEFVQLVKAIFG